MPERHGLKPGFLVAALIILLLLAGCGAPATQETAAPVATQPPALSTAAPATAAGEATEPPSPVVTEAATAPATQAAPSTAEPTPSGPTFQNPVLRDNFPDPFLLEGEEGIWYAYSTNSGGRNVPFATSEDLVTWRMGSDSMPALAPWVRLSGPDVWAPEVIKVAEKYVLYYTARDKTSRRQCVGVATADRPEGKFRDTSDQPLVCQVDEGGTIDASPFQDGNKLYLYYKNDGNCCGIPTYLYVQELAPDGLSLVGEPTRLVRNDAQWEGQVVEAPTMLKHEDRYYLFFSANSYAGFEYAVGYATCDSPLGPCTDAPENPILKSQMQKPPDLVIGPGHQDIVQVDEQHWIVYHVWEVAGGLRGDRRQLWIDQLDWENGKPVVEGPTTGPQEAPIP